MQKFFEGKTVLITGATHGLGKVLAEKIASGGGKLILVARNQGLLEKVKQEIQKSGAVQAATYACDVRNIDAVHVVMAEIMKAHDIDVLINNAGIWTEDELEADHPELRRAALETNTIAHVEITEALLPHFRKKNSGHIFNVISASGASDSPSGDNSSWRAYGASKWAMRGYTNALLSLLKDTKIKVTGFYPGGFDSNIFETAGNKDAHDQPWMMNIGDVADVALFTLTRPADVLMETVVVTKKQ